MNQAYQTRGSLEYHPRPAVAATNARLSAGMMMNRMRRTKEQGAVPGWVDGTSASSAPTVNVCRTTKRSPRFPMLCVTELYSALLVSRKAWCKGGDICDWTS